MFCEYSNIFGKPNEGVHSIKLFNISIIDVIVTIIFAYLINTLTLSNNFLLIFIVLIVCGIILHRLFCVRTTIDKLLFN